MKVTCSGWTCFVTVALDADESVVAGAGGENTRTVLLLAAGCVTSIVTGCVLCVNLVWSR